MVAADVLYTTSAAPSLLAAMASAPRAVVGHVERRAVFRDRATGEIREEHEVSWTQFSFAQRELEIPKLQI